MSDIDDIVTEWETDAKYDVLHMDNEALRTCQLHSKYLRLLVGYKKKKTGLQIRLNEIKQRMTRYYNGEMSLDEVKQLNLEQWQGNKPKSRHLMEQLLAADPDVNRILMQFEAVDDIIETLESIISIIKSRDFQIKNWKDIQAFNRGEIY